MKPLIITHDTLDEAVRANDMLVVDMWASWCAPCRRFSPIFEEMAENTPDIAFATFQVDASEENQDAFDATGFRTVPTVLAFKGGTLATHTSGALGKADLVAVLDKLRATPAE
jgi:thiol-disulfide isomerase/thioredoxin